MVEMNRWVDEQLASGRIRPSKSPYASPSFFKHEKDKLQPIIDYSRLNKYLIKDKYPLPLIQDMVDVLKGSTIYSKIDAKGGFPSMQVWPEHQHCCAFLTPRGLFELAIMWFGALSTGKWATTKALVNSGCTNCFMDLEWEKRVGLEPSPLLNLITMYNVDRSQNREGKIRFGIELLVKVGDHHEWVHFLLGKIQSHKVILGHDWLKQHNPDIDWKKAELSLTHCPPQCSPSPQAPTPLKTSTLTSARIPDTCFPNSGPTPDWPSRYPSVFSEARWEELRQSQPDFDIKIEFKKDPENR